MSNLAKSKIILLKKTKYGESDLIVQGITPTGEKLSFIARGALRSKKRFAGGLLEPTHYLEVQYKKPINAQQLCVMEDALLLDDFQDLRKDYDKLSLALRLVEIIAKVVQEGDSQSESLFNLLGHGLRRLQSIQNTRSFCAHFYIKLLHQQGVLEIQPWMESLLKTSIAQPSGESEVILSLQQWGWLESQMERYLQTAERH